MKDLKTGEVKQVDPESFLQKAIPIYSFHRGHKAGEQAKVGDESATVLGFVPASELVLIRTGSKESTAYKTVPTHKINWK